MPRISAWRTKATLARLGAIEGELVGLALAAEYLLELDLAVEVVLEGLLAPRGDDDDLVDARGEEFVDDVRDRGLRADGQELLGDGLGDGKEARAVAGRDDDAFHASS